MNVQAACSEVARNFSHAATQYDDIAHIQQRIASHAMQLLPLSSGHLLDVGCGTGKNTAQLDKMGFTAQGIDIAPGMVQVAQERYPELVFSVGDAQHLPFCDASFDCIFSSMALQWCSNSDTVMDQINRVLVPGGTAALSIMVDGSFTQLNQSRQRCGLAVTTNLMASFTEWVNAAHKAGFTVRLAGCEEYVDEFNDILGLLRSIKAVGAGARSGAVTVNTLTRQDLRALNQAYQKYLTPSGKLPLTYRIAHLTLEK
ncbi:methyltransferase domain-containing protein [Salinimonas chungwhensis]|uniref:methyltransferase domain-containing protein n=1 Tax=Salinimonas chungwhensis TaxID=265425 RepID=UPI000364D3E3|nr:methyltransferase domain-containing protein [Salinimonas chungwhensis]